MGLSRNQLLTDVCVCNDKVVCPLPWPNYGSTQRMRNTTLFADLPDTFFDDLYACVFLHAYGGAVEWTLSGLPFRLLLKKPVLSLDWVIQVRTLLIVAQKLAEANPTLVESGREMRDDVRHIRQFQITLFRTCSHRQFPNRPIYKRSANFFRFE